MFHPHKEVVKEEYETIDVERKPVNMYRVRDMCDINGRSKICAFSLWKLRTFQLVYREDSQPGM